MSYRQDTESPDLLEEHPEDLGLDWNRGGSGRKRKGLFGSNFEPRSLIVAGVGIFVLIIVLSVLFRSCGGTSSQDMAALKARLDQIETKLPQMAATEQEITKLKEQMSAIQQSVAIVEGSKKSLEDEMNRLVQEMGQVAKEKAASPARAEAAPSASKKSAVQGKRRSYVVRSGDTLYGIAQKFSMSVADLCRLNNITPAQTLHLGQKLLVASSRR
jgi:LysM repeat protein